MSSTVLRDEGFSVTTRINASPRALYAAWTEQTWVERWLANSAELDVRVNGRYMLKWPMPEGELSARGEYLELEPGERIVMTWQSWGPEGRIADGDATLRIDFEDLGDGSTNMTQTEWGPTYRDRAKIEMSMGGTRQVHAALAKLFDSDVD